MNDKISKFEAEHVANHLTSGRFKTIKDEIAMAVNDTWLYSMHWNNDTWLDQAEQDIMSRICEVEEDLTSLNNAFKLLSRIKK